MCVVVLGVLATKVARCVRLPSLHKLLDELPTLPWVEVHGSARENLSIRFKGFSSCGCGSEMLGEGSLDTVQAASMFELLLTQTFRAV